jgi:hypothetical protein
MLYARIQNGIVAELLETNGDITEMFNIALTYVACSADVQEGYIYNGSTFTAPTAPAVDLRAAILYQLLAIDQKSVRPMRAIAAGAQTDADAATLTELNGQAEALRAQLAAL